MTLHIFHQDFTTFLTTTVEFKLMAVMTTLNSCKEIKILNIFNDDDYNTSQALISYNELGIKKCVCLQLLSYDKPEQLLISKNYTITTIPSETFFATDYIQILKGVQVLSYCIEINHASKVQPLSSITCILTDTGYILKFVDSVLTACISITANCEAVNWTEGVGEYSNIKMINLTSLSGDDKTAVQINSICYLISWTKEKVEKYWSSVLTINSCDFQHCGLDLLVVVFSPSHCEPTADDVLVFPSLKELDVVVVEGDKDFENDPENEIAITGRQLMKKEHLEQPQCAVTALLSRKMTCESALRTSESMLRSKVAFVKEVWHQISRFNLHQQGCRITSQPTLVPIIKGSVLPSSGDSMERKPYTSPLEVPVQYLSFEKLWTRSVHSQLVVGLCVTNVYTKPLSGIHIKLIPSSCCTAHCVESLSKTIKSGNTTSVSPCSLNDKCFLETTQQKKVHLCPGQSEQLTCSVEISQTIIKGHLKLFCFISCLENFHPNCQFSGSVNSHQNCHLAGPVHIFCREVVVNLEDFILGKMAISCSSEKKISNEDLQALDCIQIGTCLQVTSLFSSARQFVKCLEKHQAFLCLQKVGQYIFTGNHQLKFCRVQVLEQTSNHMVDIVTYTKSDYETLNMIQLLHSILPDDFTITMKSSNKEFQNLRETVLKEVETRLQSLRQSLQNECHSNI
ncbi:unnamed protein product [Lymnaea stagnalis]|uniref:Fanconi anemia group B protein n=1 Tax=Lymnaea stagnalis TaxID=6523 RepID=A0AAV2HYB1_LYMST